LAFKEGLLLLEDGTMYRGMGFGAPATNVGELVFNTSMTGYQGILTDPSYSGQIINMTYPLIGNYGVSDADYQSERIHAFGLVTRDISFRPSNRMSVMNIGDWLTAQGIPGVYYVDTRAITKKIRLVGTAKCLISNENIGRDEALKLLAETELHTNYMRTAGVKERTEIKGEKSRFRVAVLDLGIKNNIVESMTQRGCDVILFPYGSTAEEILAINPDGFFLSNGPGDPEQATLAIETTKALMTKLPTFGICMGHQVLAIAAGGETYKLKFGHRGGNHGVLDKETGRSAITSQNHSFAVKPESVEAGGMIITHTNLNDGTVEGMRHKSLPVFSVQYHPEGSPGPNDSQNLFDRFVEIMMNNESQAVNVNAASAPNNLRNEDGGAINSGRDPSLKKVLIIGSGPIIIGQAAEFDYAGTQSCKAIREEGIECVLVNSNPATIMTDPGIADRIYIEPLTEHALEAIIAKERPDGILAGFGGQTGLNLAMALEKKGTLAKFGARLLGVNMDSIRKAEDREEFRDLMMEIGEPIPKSIIATQISECEDFVKDAGYPVIIRPAYTLGGTGGGIAANDEELRLLTERGLENSAIGQILLEESVAGWKEIEFEVMRDAKDNCITVCGMENFDPVGVHTGDSIVIAPIQTLRDAEYQMLRDSALKIIRALKIEGGCNVQFALDPATSDYIVIEVNPRVSRSSALASKAAGYPIAKLAAKIALGYGLDDLKNYVTGETSALFEPTLDYCVVKFPKWPFDKFKTASRRLGTQMKATGEVMAISRTFESALLKAVASLEIGQDSMRMPHIAKLSDAELVAKIEARDDERIFAIAEAMRRGRARQGTDPQFTREGIFKLTKVDPWFLSKVDRIVKMEKTLAETQMDAALLYEAEELGFIDAEILSLSDVSTEVLRDIRVYNNIFPVFKMVDTCGGEFEALTPYYYSCFENEDESRVSDEKKILVVGSGPIRIGQGIEFDYCCVQAVRALRDLGYEAVIVNNNPETVSTDFDTSDKLYFEPMHIDDVMNVIKNERPDGVMLQFGGQTSLNIAEALSKRGIKILGTSFASIDLAEDRKKFNELLKSINIPTPEGRTLTNREDAAAVVRELGYPLVVRPSYVIGGRAMQVVYSDAELYEYLDEAVSLGVEHPVLIDKYIEGREVEVDAVADGADILIPGIMEHVERTCVHSGDSMSVYPPHTISDGVAGRLVDYTKKITAALGVVGLLNIQYAYDPRTDEIFVIEVNPRASRTVPIISKVTGVPLVKLAVAAMLGAKLADLGFGTGLYPKMDFTAVKVPIFSSAKLTDVDIALGPEMKSTGEILAMDENYEKAVYKGFLAANISIPTEGCVYVSLRDPDKTEFSASVLRGYADENFSFAATAGTAEFMREHEIECIIMEGADDVKREIASGKIGVIINVPEFANKIESDSFAIRRYAIERNHPVMTCMDTAAAFLVAIRGKKMGACPEYKTLDEYTKK
jgi:carbamoyl-phosphate synthase large subunit